MDAASILILLAAMGVNSASPSANDAPPAAPVRHTSHFAGQAGWGPDRSTPPPAAAPTYDRYSTPLGGTAVSGTAVPVSPPPNVVERTRTAVIESGNALRDGVEAGIQAANRQLYQGGEQVVDKARNAGQEFTNQFQGWAGTTAQPAQNTASNATGILPQTTSSRQQVSNPFSTAAPAASGAPAATTRTRSGVAPPPWAGSSATNEPDWANDLLEGTTAPRTAARTTAAVRTDSGWTSVHSSVAPPALSAPRLVNAPETAVPPTSALASTAPLQPMVGEGGPNFPVTVSANQPVDHSLLAQPQQPPAASSANENWGLGWDGKTASQPSQPATIGNRYDSASISSGAVAAQDRGFAAPQRPAAQPAAAPSQGSPPAPTFGIGAFDRSPWPENPAIAQNGPIAAPIAGSSASQPPVGATSTMGTPQNVAGIGLSSTAVDPMAGAAPTPPSPPGEQLPWMPLLVVSLALAGSVGANLFLGWSYVDARQKYRTLVQKTANKFRRATA